MTAISDPKKYILVLDDYFSIRELLKYVLEDAGFEVETFADVQSASESLHQRIPDLFILDWMLPGEPNGIQWLQILRRQESTQKKPIIIITARSAPIDRELAMNLGASDFIEKSGDREWQVMLVTSVDELLLEAETK